MNRVHALAASVWHAFADPVRLLWLASSAILGLGLALLADSAWGQARLIEAASGNALVARAAALLDLHQAPTSWWFLVLVTAAGLSAVATAAEVGGLLIVRLRSSVRRPGPAALAEGVAAVGAGLSGDLRQGAVPGRVVFWRAPAALFLGALVLTGAVALGVGGLLWERASAFEGEVLLRPGDVTVTVQVPGPGGQVDSRPLGTRLQLLGTTPEGEVTVRAGDDRGPELRLRPDRPLDVHGILATPRRFRESDADTRVRLELIEREGDREAVSLGIQDTATVGQTTFTVLALEQDLRGQGTAVRLGVEGPAGDEQFWVFARDPDFDLENRAGDYSARWLGVERGQEVVLAAAYHPGWGMLRLAAGLLLLAAVLLVVGARKGAAVVVEEGAVVGAPAGDPWVEAALDRVGGEA